MNFKRLLSLLLFVGLFFSAPVFGALNLNNLVLPTTTNASTTVQGSFNITNSGTAIQTVTFTTTQMTYSMYHFNGPAINPISLNAGETKSVNFALIVPEKQYYGTYTGTITATNGSETKALTLTISVNPQQDFSIPSSIAQSVAKGLSKSAKLNVSNLGNSQLQGVIITFSALTSGSNTIPSSSIVLSDNNFQIAYNGSKEVTVTFNIASTIPAGVYTGNYSVKPNGLTKKTGNLQLTVTEPVYSLSTPSEVLFSDVERDTTLSKTFVIKNDGDFPLTGITITSDANSDYNVAFSNVPTTLAVGESKTVTVQIKIPDDENTGVKEIGKINIVSTELTKEIPLKVNPENMLNVRDLDFYVDGKDQDVDQNGGDTAELKPGATVEVRAKVENLFSSSSGNDLNDVTMNILIEGIDDGDDIEENTGGTRIRADKYETLSLKFDVPLKVDEDTFTTTITIEGEDDNGATHTVTIDMDAEIKKESHDVRITTFTVNPETVTCQKTFQLDTEITNMGTHDEDEVVYTIKSNALGIDLHNGELGDYLELSSDYSADDNSLSKTYTLSLPENVKPGTYVIEMRVYRNRNDLEELKTTILTVNKCEDNTPVTPPPTNNNTEKNNTEENKPVEVVYTTPGNNGPVVATSNNNGNNFHLGTTEWIIIGVLGGLLILLIILLIALLLK